MREQVFDFVLSDEQIRTLLERGETLFIKQPGTSWQSLERQIERLGFGDSYFVTQVSARRGEFTKISPALARAA